MEAADESDDAAGVFAEETIVMPVAEEPDAAQGLVGDGSTGVAAARQVVKKAFAEDVT